MLSPQHMRLFFAMLVIGVLISTEAWAYQLPRKTCPTLDEQLLTFAPASTLAPRPTQRYNH